MSENVMTLFVPNLGKRLEQGGYSDGIERDYFLENIGPTRRGGECRVN